jgi:hypothetical protein
MNLADLFPPRDKNSPDYVPAQRQPWSAADILRAARYEITLAAVAACNIAKGTELGEDDRKRLLLAAERLYAAAHAYA